MLGPLAKEAGGFGTCGEVFEDKDDVDYRRLVAALEKAKEVIDAEPRYSTQVSSSAKSRLPRRSSKTEGQRNRRQSIAKQ